MACEPAAKPCIEYLPDCTDRDIQEVLALLDKWSQRNASHVTHLRGAERRDFRGLVVTIASNAVPGTIADAPQGATVTCRVPARNISQTGFGFIAPPVFAPRWMSDGTPLLKTCELFRPGRNVTLQFERGGAAPLQVDATVVRLRPVHRGFFEVGVRFCGRKPAGNVERV
jgi:hypothetical protein